MLKSKSRSKSKSMSKSNHENVKQKEFRTQPVKTIRWSRFDGEDPYDPIQRVIDHQLAIPWCAEWFHHNSKSDKSYISSSSSRGSSSMQKKNDIENRILGAIEWKYKRKLRNWKIFKLYLDGFSQQQLSDKFELSDRQIRRIIKKVK